MARWAIGEPVSAAPCQCSSPAGMTAQSPLLMTCSESRSATLPMPDVAEKGDPNTPIPKSFGTPEQIAEGNELYHSHCARCHGFEAVSDGVIRDLRYSTPGVHAAWNGIVLEGAFAELGMAGFGDILTPADAQALRSYVVEQANARRPP